MFFSFDGVDGVGKSTQLELFADNLRQRGYEVVCCRDPGGTGLGEQVRELLLNQMQLKIARTSEMLLYMASRAQLVDEVIAPALSANKVVVTDRFLLSNVVYQGLAGRLGAECVWQVGQVATGGLAPDLTFVLDMEPEAAIARLDRGLDRMELQGDAFQRDIRQGFLAEAARNPDQIALIDASGRIGEVQAAIQAAATRVLGE